MSSPEQKDDIIRKGSIKFVNRINRQSTGINNLSILVPPKSKFSGASRKNLQATQNSFSRVSSEVPSS